MSDLKSSRNYVFLIFLNLLFCDIFQHIALIQTNKSTTYQYQIINNVAQPLKYGALLGFGWSGEGYCDSDINRLSSVNLW